MRGVKVSMRMKKLLHIKYELLLNGSNKSN